jgi:hypothetical protein
MGNPPQGISSNPGGARPEPTDFGALLGRKRDMINNYENGYPIPENNGGGAVPAGKSAAETTRSCITGARHVTQRCKCDDYLTGNWLNPDLPDPVAV